MFRLGFLPHFPCPNMKTSPPWSFLRLSESSGSSSPRFLYVVRPALAESLKTAAGPLYTLVANKYYVDEIYSGLIVKPLEGISRFVLWKGVDEGVIDNSFVNGLAGVVRGWGALFRHLQSGSIRNYATWVFAGSLLVILHLWSRRRRPLNLLAITLALPLIGFFILLFLPRNRGPSPAVALSITILTFLASLGTDRSCAGNPAQFTSRLNSRWIDSPGLADSSPPRASTGSTCGWFCSRRCFCRLVSGFRRR